MCMALSVSTSFSVKGWIISVISLGFSSANKLSLILFFVFTSSLWDLLTLYELSFFPGLVQLLALHHQHWVILIFRLLLQLNLSFESAMSSTHLLLFGRSGLLWPTEVTFTLSVGAHSVTTTWKSFSYLYGCALTAATAVNTLSHLMLLIRYQTFDPGSRPWHPYFIRFPRLIWFLTYQATYISQFHPFFSSHTRQLTFPSSIHSFHHHTKMFAMLTWLVALTWIGPIHLEWMA